MRDVAVARAHSHPRFHRAKGLTKEALGWLTADRRLEAAGEAEAWLADRPTPELTARMEHLVHERYGEVDLRDGAHPIE